MPAATSGTVLITGANRGIGLEFVRQYAADGWRVLATCRDPARAAELSALPGEVEVLPLDVTSDASCAALAQSVAGRPIDVLINNAGFARRGQRIANTGLATVETSEFAEVLDINVIGPFRVTRALLANLRAGERRLVGTVSSRMGSITWNKGGSYAYRASKSAVNMVMSCFALELAPEGFTFLVLHPGWVRTDMGGSGADLDVADSVAGLRRVLAGVGPADSGRFINHDGTSIPW